ncbi:uncharacterized protein DMAD_12187 [Drosophila madeirensis]|uniref:Uncharacterized protein n=1 Tax=Drosophila madeirensis TaxID=30013 RepID=A0AAU9FFU9_DROMD
MQPILGLLMLCVAIYSVVAAPDTYQHIGGRRGLGDSDESLENLKWSDSVHSADTDEILKRLAAFENIGRDSNSGSDSDSDSPPTSFQLMQF